MNAFFYIVAISFLVVSLLVGTYLKKKVSSRVFDFDFAIEEKRNELSWKTFIWVVFLLIIILTNWSDIGFTIFSIFSISVLFYEYLLAKKINYKSYLIRDTKLIYNGWYVKEFDLEELESIHFLPFTDSFKLFFKNKKTIVIARNVFDKNILANFIQKVIQLSSKKIEIEQDAMTKIYV
ncbi:MAG: hypothetical protein KA319_02390 [Ferruginibacter sp.]|nr:hypothetical protein [Ferruginibacter sp.]